MDYQKIIDEQQKLINKQQELLKQQLDIITQLNNKLFSVMPLPVYPTFPTYPPTYPISPVWTSLIGPGDNDYGRHNLVSLNN